MTNFEKLQKLLEELFQLDQADLDFGIYRIMNQKRDEVVRFLEKDLLPQVKAAFGHYKSAQSAEGVIRRQRDRATDTFAPSPPPVVSPSSAIDSSVDVTALENEVFSHLFNFFRRYYHEGDFISLRRYKEGVYAIPYEGEEVKLHWANHDQYYVKSSEYFRDYIFTMPSGKRVRVHLVAASSEQDNKKEAPGKERRFIICAEDPIYEENGELYIRFEYKPDDGKKKQDALNQEAIERVLNAKGFEEWTRELSKPAPTKSNPKRTVLEKHLTQYTARNTFDYFIHKDLGGFLRRELDFYIKNEVMHLDDIEHDTVPRVEQYLSKIKVIRKIAHKVIQFLEQLENFQKKLWLKKKFVVETNYCITLDRVPEQLYPEIAANDAQREEWVQLFGIDTISQDLNQPGYTVPLKAEFLKAQPLLVVDTRHFTSSFKDKLRTASDGLHESQPRCLLQSDNFHALELLLHRFSSSIRCVYIDPPYNTGSDEFLYKDHYQHSSWAACLFDRLTLAHRLLTDDGAIMVSIGEEELGTLQQLLDVIFGRENRIAVITVKRASVTGHKAINPGVVNVSEFVLLYAKSRRDWTGNTVYAERERDERYSTFIKNRNAEPSGWEFVSVLDAFSESVGVEKRQLRNHFGEQYESELTKFVYDNANAVCQPVTVDLGGVGAEFREWVQKSVDAGDEVLQYRRDGFPDAYLRNGKKLVFYQDKMMQVGERLATAEKASDIWTDVLPNDLHNEGGVELPKGKKPEALLSRLIELGTNEGDIVLDFFAGTATAAAVAQKTNRRWVAVENATFFVEKPLRRMKNTLNGESRGISTAFGWKGGGNYSVVTLESYEDVLNNLEMKRTPQQASLLEQDDDLREQYVLSYMLDVESRGSQSLLNYESFRNPDQYKLRVERNGETQLVNVDLVETFNWLLGLTVKHIDVIRGVRVVTGTRRGGEGATGREENCLVLWRNLDETDNNALDEWFQKQDYNTKDQEYDLIYVNGDNNLENLRRGDQTWKVRLIEEEFGRLMFEVQDV
ncbi:MAG: site-specific DNA-methyltransferase [Pirellulaceae bacterium]|nr:site-specific DNA-methyltransferase [Pirellulaceae bacterium]